MIVVACGALGVRAMVERPQPVRVVVVPAPPVMIPLLVPPPPPARTGCGDVTTIGLPTARVTADVNAPELVDVAVSREGCVLAARTKDTLSISWDGGQTFSRLDQKAISHMVALADRVVVLLEDGRLGTVAPEQPMSFHAVPARLGSGGSLLADESEIAIVADGLVAVTGDAGSSWRYVEPLTDMTITRLDHGRLVGTIARPTSEPDGEHLVEYVSTTYANELGHPGWDAVATHAGTVADEEGRYALAGDQYWGCGMSEELVDIATGAVVAGGLRPEVWPVEVHTTHGVTFASLHDQLVQLGTGIVVVDEEIPGALAGVDAAGTPLVRTPTQLLRWSKAGGWRVLL